MQPSKPGWKAVHTSSCATRSRSTTASLGPPNQPERSLDTGLPVDSKHCRDLTGPLTRTIADSPLRQGTVSGKITSTLQEINALVDSLPPLMDLLHQLVPLYPLLARVVQTFDAVTRLELQRHGVDTKVKLVFLEMRNIMAVILQLRSVQVAEDDAPDGIPLPLRLYNLVVDTNRDILEGANACDAYMSGPRLAQAHNAHQWNEILFGYVRRFRQRQADFALIVALYSEPSNSAVDELKAYISQPYDTAFVTAFLERSTPRWVHTSSFSATAVRNGGHGPLRAHSGPSHQSTSAQQLERLSTSSPSVLDHSHVWDAPQASLQRASSFAFSLVENSVFNLDGPHRANARPTSRLSQSLHTAHRDRMHLHRAPYGISLHGGFTQDDKAYSTFFHPNHYCEEPEAILRSNFMRFERKFEVQRMILLSSGWDSAPHDSEGDRYPRLSQPEEPYGLIVDPEFRELWGRMQWGDHVETRRFVSALHWYYARQYVDQQHAALRMSPQGHQMQEDDMWMSRYLNHCHVQGIIDVLDHRATGVVSIDDLNRFAAARPRDWSLIRWIVYWAIGWQVAMSEYKRRIYALLARMYRLCTASSVPPAGVPQYLAKVEPLITSMTCTFDTTYCSTEYEALFKIHFRRYTKELEGTIWFYLETLQYDLDGTDTIELLSGPLGGVETSALIVLYILLRQHYNIMKLAQKVVISTEELASAPTAIMVVRDAMERRAQGVAGQLTARQLDVNSEINLFAYGLLAGSYGPSSLPPSDFSILAGVALDKDDTETEDSDVMESETILKYPCFRNEFYAIDWERYTSHVPECPEGDPLRPLLGCWTGRQISNDNERIRASTFVYNFQMSRHGEPGKAIASPAISTASWFSHPSVSGEFAGTTPEGELQYVVTIACDSVQAAMFSLRLTLSKDGTTLYGEQDDLGSFKQPSHKPQVIMKKGVAPEAMIYYPSPTALRLAKAKSLWDYAISTILYDTRRRRFSWEFIRERRDRKRLLSSLLYAEASNGYLHTEDDWERARLLNITLPEDVQFFAYAALEPTKFPWLLPWCDGCHRVLRTVEPCLRCCSLSSATMCASSVALCDREECLDEYSRYPSNRILKTRTAEWTMDRFTAETDVTVTKLDELFERAVRAIRRAPSSIWEDQCDLGEEVGHAFLSGIDKESDSDGYGRFFSLACSDGTSSLPRRTSSQWSLSLESDASIRTSSFRAPYSSRPRCIGCRTTVVFPCWVCTQCPDPTYICPACDAKGGIAYLDHEERHALLRVRDARVPSPDSSPESSRSSSPSLPSPAFVVRPIAIPAEGANAHTAEYDSPLGSSTTDVSLE